MKTFSNGELIMKIDRIDHIVLTVESIDVTIEFYARFLGMEPITFAGGRRGLAFGAQKINLHSAENPYPKKLRNLRLGRVIFA